MKVATAQYTYAFAGWTPTISKVTGNATYTATYTNTVNQYTVTFKNEDGTVLQTGKWDYNDTPTYSGNTPTKAATDQYTYTFAGWTPTIAKVTGNATYTATFTSTDNQYTVTFKNEGGTVLQTGKWNYNATPTYSGETPTKAATAQYTFTFAGWTPTIAKVTGNATYTATFTNTVNQYTVTFKNEDGTVLQSGKWDYNDTPIYSGDTPVKAATAQYTYTFTGWAPAVAKVTGNATYTATFTSAVNQYVVYFDASNGTCNTSNKTVTFGESYGTLPVPTREGFTFVGWFTAANGGVLVNADTVVAITENQTLYAHWEDDTPDPDAPRLALSSETVKPGDQVEVTLSISNNPGIISTSVNITYDNTKLRLISVTDGGLMGTGTFFPGKDYTEIPYTVIWEDGLADDNYTGNGILATFTFEVLEDAEPGETPITLNYVKNSTLNVDIDEITFALTSGVVEISDRTPGDASGDGIIDLKDVVMLRRYLTGGWDVTVDVSNADVNADGVLDLKDVVLLRRYLSGGWDVVLK